MAIPFKLHVLGCYAATPNALTHPTAQVLETKNHHFLIDCGEGTQVEMRRNRIKFSRVKHIFISHLHGDHFFGLPGLVSTFQLLGRKTELHIYGPEGIEEGIRLLLKLGNSWLGYPLIFHELNATTSECIFEDKSIKVCTIPLKHRIYTNGFLFIEKHPRLPLNVEAVENYGIDKAYYRKIIEGGDVTLNSGEVIENSRLTLPAPPVRKYAYCSDTAYHPDMIPLIKGASLLYHEATFLESEADIARKTGHSTAAEAARIAQAASVQSLMLGHYSTRYRSLLPFKAEAEPIFPAVHLAREGEVFEF